MPPGRTGFRGPTWPWAGPPALWQAAATAAAAAEASLEAVRDHLSLSALELDGERARLTDAETALDLGCVAKGYAADLAAEKLRELGVSAFLLDCGTSTIRCGEVPPAKRAGAWR